MMPDLPERLRRVPVVFKYDILDQTVTDYEATRIVRQLNEENQKIRIEAAEEIERLRKGGCARDQRTTQYCAEALTIQKNLDIVTGELGTAHIAIETLHSQRDEARREVCEVVASRYEISPEAEAKIRGWDCFKENKGA